MNIFYVVIYLVSLCLLVGCGFAMMYANLKSIQEDMDKPIKRRTERPQPPKSVIYYDGSTEATRKRLEDLYND